MPASKIIRFRDREARPADADAIDRDPSETAVIIVLPVTRVERYGVERKPFVERAR